VDLTPYEPVRGKTAHADYKKRVIILVKLVSEHEAQSAYTHILHTHSW